MSRLQERTRLFEQTRVELSNLLMECQKSEDNAYKLMQGAKKGDLNYLTYHDMYRQAKADVREVMSYMGSLADMETKVKCGVWDKQCKDTIRECESFIRTHSYRKEQE